MFARLISAIAIAATGALGGIGPQALYNLLNGQTFNPPGYTIVMYQSCMQNQNAGNPCGSFTTFESSNGVYTYQRYGPEAPVSPSCSRTFYLTLACGATMSMSGVNENPTCVYSATLTLPQACGIDMRVGNEAASVSGTAVPATPSETRSITGSASPSPQPTICVIMNPAGIVDNSNAGVSSSGDTINHIIDPPPPIGALPPYPYWNPGVRSVYQVTLSFVEPAPVYYCDYWGANTATHSATGIAFSTAPSGTLLYASASTTSPMRNASYSFPFTSYPNVSSVYMTLYKSTSFQARTYYLACYTCMVSYSSVSASPNVTMTVSWTGSPTVSFTGSGSWSGSWTSSFSRTSSGTMSLSPTPDVTPSSLYAMTAYPSQTTSPSIPATTTPLFMITAWPTVSPVNVSAAIGLAESMGITPGSQTATILSAVALGVIGVALVVGAVVYFRKGGSIAGLAEKVKANKGLITKAASMLPLTDEQKAKVNAAVNDPTSLLPEQAQQAIEIVKDCDQKMIAALPISDTQKAQLTSAVSSVKDRVVKKMEASPTGTLLTPVLGTKSVASKPVASKPVASKPVTPTQEVQQLEESVPVEMIIEESVPEESVPEETKPVESVSEETKQVETVSEETKLEETKPEETKLEESVSEVEPSLVTVQINPEDIEAVKAFLAAKHANTTD